MPKLNFIESVTERDIDLLVLEELSVNESFREMFLTNVFGEPVYHKFIGAWHSVCSENLGETDILFMFEAMNSEKTAILIENKINAGPMPDQGQRYRQRGENGCKNGIWQKFKTCIIAPQKYLISVSDAKSYDCKFSYENIHSYFVSQGDNDNRSAYKANVILEGIEQNRRGYQPVENELVTLFVKQYFDYAYEKYPKLKMQEAKSRQAGSSWIAFYPDVLLSQKGVGLAHQMNNGEVKLLFKEKANHLDTIRAKYQSSLSERMFIKKAGQSAAIMMRVKKIDPLKQNFDDVKEIIESALDCLSQLSILLSENNSI